MVEWREMKKGKGKGSGASSSDLVPSQQSAPSTANILISGAKAGVETLAKAGATALAKSFLTSLEYRAIIYVKITPHI